jgi:hypothetical protein
VLDSTADVPGFWAKEDVKDELSTVDLYRRQCFELIRKRFAILTIARIQYIQRYPTWYATNPKMKGAIGTPRVTINVQIPMYLARSFLKNVSVTTALPIAAAGLIKKATMALHTAIDE